MKKNKKNMYHRLFSRLMAVLLLFTVSAIVGIYPFGDKSVLTGDLNSIYLTVFKTGDIHFKKTWVKTPQVCLATM